VIEDDRVTLGWEGLSEEVICIRSEIQEVKHMGEPRKEHLKYEEQQEKRPYSGNGLGICGISKGDQRGVIWEEVRLMNSEST
jgi:hypothetical protein